MDDHASSRDAMGLAPIRSDFIPAADYTDPEVPRLEKERLWPRVWQIACREEEIPKVGDYVNFQLYSESILVVRVAKDQIKAFYNVCQHRGRRLVDGRKGNLGPRGFFCRFHGWRFNLDGSLAYVHYRDNWNDCPTFKDNELDLKEPKIGFWAGWVWINMDPNAGSLEEFLNPVPAFMKNLELEKLRFTWYETIIADVNWKTVVEAFNEGYHSGATHNSAVGYTEMQWPSQAYGDHGMYWTIQTKMPRVLKDGSWQTAVSLPDLIYWQSLELYEKLGAQVMEPAMKATIRLKDETLPDATPETVIENLFQFHKEELEKTGAEWPPHLTQDDLNKVGTSWHVFPNTIFLPTVDGVLWYRFRPHGDNPDKCIFDIWCLSRYAKGKEPKVEQRISHGFDEFRGNCPFLEQDFDNMMATNEGMKSRGWVGARTNCVQEVVINNFHRALRKYLYD